MRNFITNSSEKTLGERLKTLISQSKELQFLVGFFYFSGIKELYEGLKKLYNNGKLNDKHIKILVGLHIDKGIWGIYEASGNSNEAKLNKEKTLELFFNSIRKALTSAELDTKEVYEQAEFFLNLLKEGKLIIRKTKEPNHAKLYLFKLNDPIVPNLFLTGSSNLTKAGLHSQYEFNVEIKDYGFEEAEEYFKHLWEKSIELKNDDIIKLEKILKRETFLRQITPFEAYAYLVKTYLDLNSGEIQKELEQFMESKGYKPYKFQLSAVSQAVQNCYYHNGTILADVVGLGKTIVACLIGKFVKLRRNENE